MTKKTSKLTTEHRARVTRNIDQAFDLIENVMEKPEDYPESFVVLPLDPEILSRVFTVERVRLFQELRRAGHVESLNELAASLGRAQSGVSRDVKALRSFGLIREKRVGKSKTFEARRNSIVVA